MSAGNVKLYSARLSGQGLNWLFNKQLVLRLQHERDGPTICVHYQQFDIASPDQTLLYWKNIDGWGFIETTAYGLVAFPWAILE